MPRISRALAARLARRLNPDDTWDDAREVCDFATGCELHAVQLDMLADWTIEARVGASSLAPERRGRFRLLVRARAKVAELQAVFGTLPAAPIKAGAVPA